MRKRLLAIIATAAMVVAMVPSMVFADETVTDEAGLNSACQTSGTVTLNGPIEVTTMITIPSGVEVVLDLNGNTLTGPDDGSANWYAFKVLGKLTLKDSSAAKTGQIYAKCYGVYIRDGGTFIMESGKIDATKNGGIGAAVVNYGGNVIINDGTLIGAKWAINAESYSGDATVTVNGGNLKGLDASEGVITLGGEYSSNKGKEAVEIKGGNFEGVNPVVIDDRATDDASLVISGGQFPVDADIDEYLAANFEVDANGKVVEKAPATSTTDKSPNTGDNSMAPIAVAGLVMAAMAAVVATRRRIN